MIKSEDHIKEIEWGAVKAGISMNRLCKKADVHPDTYLKMRKRVFAGGEIGVATVNKLYEALERKND